MIKIHLSRKLGEVRWSQATLARVTEIRPSTISDLYNEMADRVNLDHLDRICKALDCPLSDIIEYIPDKEKKQKHNEGNHLKI
jgi:putative transcriptional regulator